MRIGVVGLGTTGSHLARQLSQLELSELQLSDPDEVRQKRVVTAVRSIAGNGLSVIAAPVAPQRPPDVVCLASPAGTHSELAASMVRAGSDVVSISDDPEEVMDLLALDAEVQRLGRSVVVGAGFAPGLSCVLARLAADELDTVEVISVYKAGTGGPACARQHHRALKRNGHDWVDGEWILRRAGSGRDLAWFPEPFGAHDCYRAALPDPVLLQRQFDQAQRISARVSATRRDRLTSRLPMLRPPHRDGGPGAIRVEVRGRRDGAVETTILGVMDHPAVAAATMATVVASNLMHGDVPTGVNGLAQWSNPKELIVDLRRRGVRVASFGGALDESTL